LGTSAKIAAILLLPAVLAACAGSDEGRGISYTDDRGVANQPFPGNYKSEIVAFMKTYLNNPVGVRDAANRGAGAACRRRTAALCFLPALHRARFRGQLPRARRERAIQFVDGRLDRIIENASEPCAGAVYGPFAELEKMTR